MVVKCQPDAGSAEGSPSAAGKAREPQKLIPLFPRSSHGKEVLPRREGQHFRGGCFMSGLWSGGQRVCKRLIQRKKGGIKARRRGKTEKKNLLINWSRLKERSSLATRIWWVLFLSCWTLSPVECLHGLDCMAVEGRGRGKGEAQVQKANRS